MRYGWLLVCLPISLMIACSDSSDSDETPSPDASTIDSSTPPDASDEQSNADAPAQETSLPEAQVESGEDSPPPVDAPSEAAAADYAFAIPPSPVRLIRGGSAQLHVEISRQGGFSDDITLQLTGLPSDVTSAPVTVPAGQSSADLVLTTPADGSYGYHSATLQASGHGIEHQADMQLWITGHPGWVDTSFGHQGWALSNIGFPTGEYAWAVAVQPDGKIVAGGSRKDPNAEAFTLAHWSVERFLPNGDRDPSFGAAGVLELPISGEVADLALTPEGDIIAVGWDQVNRPGFKVARIQNTGVLDPAFGQNGIAVLPGDWTEGASLAVGLQSDGSILAVGFAADSSAVRKAVVARFTPTGQLDSSFGAQGIALSPIADSFLYGIDVGPDDSIVATGMDSSADAHTLVTRFSAQGQPDPAFGTEGTVTTAFGADEGCDIRILDNNSLFLAGASGPSGSQMQAMFEKLLPDGSVDTTFGAAGINVVGIAGTARSYFFSLLRQPSDGKLIAIGSGDASGDPGGDNSIVVRLLPDGTPDTGFAGQGTYFYGHEDGEDAESMVFRDGALQPDGSIIVVGNHGLGGWILIRLFP